MLAVAEVEQDRVAVGGQEDIPAGIVQAVDLHVPRIASVTDVDRVEENDAGEVAGDESSANPLLAVEAQRRPIERSVEIEGRPKHGHGWRRHGGLRRVIKGARGGKPAWGRRTSVRPACPPRPAGGRTREPPPP